MTPAGKMETVSKKGRPRAFPETYTDGLRRVAGNMATERTLTNWAYLNEAINALRLDPSENPRVVMARYPQLGDFGNRLRKGALVEIGRAARQHGPEVAQWLAEQVNAMLAAGDLRNTRHAERWVRFMRIAATETAP